MHEQNIYHIVLVSIENLNLSSFAKAIRAMFFCFCLFLVFFLSQLYWSFQTLVSCISSNFCLSEFFFHWVHGQKVLCSLDTPKVIAEMTPVDAEFARIRTAESCSEGNKEGDYFWDIMFSYLMKWKSLNWSLTYVVCVRFGSCRTHSE